MTATRPPAFRLVALLLSATVGCSDPLAGFGPTGQVRVTVQTIGPMPAADYCLEVEIHDLTWEYQGQSQTPNPVLNTVRVGIGANEERTFEAQVGERGVELFRAPPVNGNCSPSEAEFIPNCLIDGEAEAHQALGKWGVELQAVVVREGQVSDVQFTVRCT